MHVVEIVETVHRPDVFEYKALVMDYDLQVFGELFSHQRFARGQIGVLTQVALQRILFEVAFSSHIRNGALEQWESALSIEMRRRFATRYDEAAFSLSRDQTIAESPAALGTAPDFS